MNKHKISDIVEAAHLSNIVNFEKASEEGLPDADRKSTMGPAQSG